MNQPTVMNSVNHTSGNEFGKSDSDIREDKTCTIITGLNGYNLNNPTYSNIKNYANGPLEIIINDKLTNNNFAICGADGIGDKLNTEISTEKKLIDTVYDKYNEKEPKEEDIKNAIKAVSTGIFSSSDPTKMILSNDNIPSDFNIDLSKVNTIWSRYSDNKWYTNAVNTLPQNCISFNNHESSKSEGYCFDINNKNLIQKYTFLPKTGLFWKEYNFDTTLKVIKNQDDINPDVCVITSKDCDTTNLDTYTNPNKNSDEIKNRCQAICFSKQVNFQTEKSYPMTYNKNKKEWEWQ